MVVAIVTSLLAAIPPTIAALASYRQARKNAASVAENTAITAGIDRKADLIHTLTDGRLTQVMSDLGSANEQIKRLDDVVRDLSAELRTRPKRG
jgi:hypothetical protein